MHEAFAQAANNPERYQRYAALMQWADLGPAIALSPEYNLQLEERMCLERNAKGAAMEMTAENVFNSHIGFQNFLATRLPAMKASPLGALLAPRVESIKAAIVAIKPAAAPELV